MLFGCTFKFSLYTEISHRTCRMTHIEGVILGMVGTMDQTLVTGRQTDNQRGQVLGPVSTLTVPTPGKGTVR